MRLILLLLAIFVLVSCDKQATDQKKDTKKEEKKQVEKKDEKKKKRGIDIESTDMEEKKSPLNASKYNKGIIKYPYKADKNREELIRQKYSEVKKGMTANEVVKILSLPDEINPTYQPKIKNSKVVGFSYVYLIQRFKQIGSVVEKNEKLVRIHFDLNQKVVRINVYALK